MKTIKILGTGCAKCNKLYSLAEEAASQLGEEFVMEKVTDLSQITSYGVMMTPALVVDSEVKSVGNVPSIDKLKELIKG